MQNHVVTTVSCFFKYYTMKFASVFIYLYFVRNEQKFKLYVTVFFFFSNNWNYSFIFRAPQFFGYLFSGICQLIWYDIILKKLVFLCIEITACSFFTKPENFICAFGSLMFFFFFFENPNVILIW